MRISGPEVGSGTAKGSVIVCCVGSLLLQEKQPTSSRQLREKNSRFIVLIMLGNL